MLTETLKHIVIVLLLTSCTAFAKAAESEKPQLLDAYVNLNDSVEVYKALYDNTPIEPMFKLVPRFAIVGLDNRFVFSLGASLKFTASFDWDNPVHNPRALSLSSVQPSLMNDRHLYQMTAGGSGIYFNIIGFPNTDHETGLFISLILDNESNNSYKLAASQVYMRYKGLQLGYASSLYNDWGADAYTIDGAGPCASGAYSTVGANWQHFFNRHLRVGIGVELPNAGFTQYKPSPDQLVESILYYSNTSNQYVPNFPFYFGYVWGPNHVRLSGVIKNIHYVNYVTCEGCDRVGYGVKLTGHAVTGPLEWYWMGQYGYASASNFKDDRDSGLDLVPDNSQPGKLIPTKTWGVIAAAQWNITPKHILTCQYSHIRNIIPYYSVNAEKTFEEQMHHGSTFTINEVWKISSLFSTGMEYRYVTKRYEDGSHITNNRVYMMFMMNF